MSRQPLPPIENRHQLAKGDGQPEDERHDLGEIAVAAKVGLGVGCEELRFVHTRPVLRDERRGVGEAGAQACDVDAQLAEVGL